MPLHQAPEVQIQQAIQDSVYFVHPSEGLNYLAWSRTMRRDLGAKIKLSLIDGSLQVLDMIDLNPSSWEWCNHLIHSWIFNLVSEPIAQTLVFHEYIFYVWEDLK